MLLEYFLPKAGIKKPRPKAGVFYYRYCSAKAICVAILRYFPEGQVVKLKLKYQGFDFFLILLVLCSVKYLHSALVNGEIFIRCCYVYRSQNPFLFYFLVSVILGLNMYLLFKVFFIKSSGEKK